MSDDRRKKLPDTIDDPQPTKYWIDGTDTYVVEVTRHDINDIAVAQQYFVIFCEDAESGRYLSSNVSVPITTEKDL
jgi:hypothetical protein